MNTKLRILLEDVPKEVCAEQEKKLNDIYKSHKHSIAVRDSDHLFHDWGTFNCFEYALGLTDLDGYVVVKKQNVFANSAFMKYLIENNLITKNSGGKTIIYFNEEREPKHAGVLINNRVLSKWGTGLVYEHEILEVPLSYGIESSNYISIENNTMLEYFFDYAETQGIKFNHD